MSLASPSSSNPVGIAGQDEVLVRVQDVSKKFCRSLKRSMFYGMTDSVREMIGLHPDVSRLRQGEFWALKDISFELKRGESLGLIGANGSGKSTLLRLLSGIFPPDAGRVEVKGRMGALIAVGAGFHPHMTGRENIYLNGTILGMSRREIDEHYDDIVAFADIGDFLGAPVATYSSGMKVRLGFAVAVFCRTDILLVDEVLSVGDLAFRNKGLRRMHEYRALSKAVLFVSHDLERIHDICTRVMILDQGKITFDGPTHEACVAYEESCREKGQSRRASDMVRIRHSDNRAVAFLGGGSAKDEVEMTRPLRLWCDFNLRQPVSSLTFNAAIQDAVADYTCIWLVGRDRGFEARDLSIGKHRLTVEIPEHHLKPGLYRCNFAIINAETSEICENVRMRTTFRVLSDGKHLGRGVISVDESWHVEPLDVTK